MSKNRSRFIEIVKKKLEERFEVLLKFGLELAKERLDEISIRMFWYQCVNEYRMRYHTETLDIANNNQVVAYKQFRDAIKAFCKAKTIIQRLPDELSYLSSYWGMLRDALNITAKERATALLPDETILMVSQKERDAIWSKGIVIIICEKETLAKKIANALSNTYLKQKVLTIITQGYSVAEVVQALLSIKNENVAIGVLHDLDIAGIGIYHDLKRYIPGLLDFGITFEMIGDEWDYLREPTSYSLKEKKRLENLGLTSLLKKLQNFRLELDSLYVAKSTDIFVKYILQLIEPITVDLNRLEPIFPTARKLYKLKRQIENFFKIIFQEACGFPWENYSDYELIKNEIKTIQQKNRNFKQRKDKIDDILYQQYKELDILLQERTEPLIKQIVDYLDNYQLLELLNIEL